MRYLLSFAIDSIHQTEILIRRIKKGNTEFCLFFRASRATHLSVCPICFHNTV